MGHYIRINAGLSQLNEAIRLLSVHRDALAEHMAQADISPLFTDNPGAVDRLLEDVQNAPTLVERETECMAALHQDGIAEMSSDNG